MIITTIRNDFLKMPKDRFIQSEAKIKMDNGAGIALLAAFLNRRHRPCGQL